jgi:hypothetical protein
VLLGVCESKDAPLVYSGEVGEEHVYSACPAIRLLGGALELFRVFFCAFFVCLVAGVACWRSGGVVSSPEYHLRRVLCIMWVAGGGWSLRESKY